MPAVNFDVRWPDGDNTTYYSPSTIIYKYLKEGNEYPIDDFKEQSISALDIASERVRERFGYYCSAASAEQEKIIKKYDSLKKHGISGTVTLTRFKN